MGTKKKYWEYEDTIIIDPSYTIEEHDKPVEHTEQLRILYGRN